ncbi:demethylmenaquinone methyltransferase [Calidifontibacter indicus]|uniref:Demethylmenaquinone methyltransferase n=1 Tax=Calidifontibacter indicus TaxID=419650 RepID=A0A3D9ULE4_9MICO|nr:demethylmenaquinone methyltransferase [Calidifontibacter indicus]REF30139.1 demethylmenaquinone methyltransferase/2-methoxy-6-polyprenyl-1,4-benzoquinol methylase [Calidifontibacter indicus]
MNRASLDKRPTDVARMFDDVAARYDITNDVMSMGQDRRWRGQVLAAVDPQPGEVILDIAAGTGTSSEPLEAAGAKVVPGDFSLGMLKVGKKRRRDLGFTAADAMRLPFGDNTFDAVTMSFGLRNVEDPVQALAEFHRVTKSGGRVVICEFSTPTNPVFRKVYSEYLMGALPRIAKPIGSNAESYVYLAESIQAWPDQQGMAANLQRAGWDDVEWRNLTGGIVALHRGRKG